MSALTHFDAHGQAHMVDVAAKPATHRIAVAGGCIEMLPATLALIEAGNAYVSIGNTSHPIDAIRGQITQ